MGSFIEDVVVSLDNEGFDISNAIFILPSKRAGLFLKETISKLTKETIFAPEILSIEKFIEKVSGLEYVSNSELLFQFYDSYLNNTPNKDIESFDGFSKWAQILIQDFNEIDRYLINPSQIFEYLSAIKQIENNHWSLDESPTQYIKNYLLFWKRLSLYYHSLKKSLLSKNLGYQGMVYKDAAEKIGVYAQNESIKKHIFLGFNALNSAEEKIIQKLLLENSAEIFWDIDEVFLDNNIHDAGHFLRKYLKSWKYFQKNPLKWRKTFYSEKKNIEIIGTPKNIGQVKYLGDLISKLNSKGIDLTKTAVVLGDEQLLTPLLNSLPQEVNRVNITMGLPLKLVPLASVFESLFQIQQKKFKSLYYKDVLRVLNNQYIKRLLDSFSNESFKSISDFIKTNNIVYIEPKVLEREFGNNKELLKLLFFPWDDKVDLAISSCQRLIFHIKNLFDSDKENNMLNKEYLFKFNTVFNELERLTKEFNHINDIKTLYGLFKELLKNESLDFQGEPLEGLQIMGMLETRVLDFETVILTSVNEGVLPAGKTESSFIPFDVKIENALPTYKEKDAVYTYHFYRLLQRAQNIFILYNTEPDVLNGGEKSRLITQLITEKKHRIIKKVISPKLPVIKDRLQKIEKSFSVLERLDKIAENGFSPSSLTNYIRNPIDFYLQKVLGVGELNDVEEHVAHNTLGTVVHNSLEDFYKPLEGQILSVDAMNKMKNNIDRTVKKHFDIEFKSGDVTKGKNLIIFQIAKRYLNNFLDTEITQINEGHTIKIIAIEANSEADISIEDIGKTICLRGKVDRVDVFNGVPRIIDYKTGRVEQGKVEIVNWDHLLTDYDKYSKSFQVLMYAYMMLKSGKIALPLEAGIISFKNLGNGLLKFGTKPTANSRKKDHVISEATIDAFETQLKSLLIEIYNPNTPFVEKVIE